MKYLNQKCIIRTNRAGVFFGTPTDFDSSTREMTITNCRRLWYWSGAASLSQLATEGVKCPNDCKFTVVVPEMIVMEVIEVIPCTHEAIKNIEEVAIWRRK
jgi:hypothetical protein